MNKPISVTLPEKLITDSDKYCDEYMMTRSELIKNALVAYIRIPVIRYDETVPAPVMYATNQPIDLDVVADDPEKQDEAVREVLVEGTHEEPDPTSEVDEVSVPQEPPQPELPPFCEANKNCHSRSTGRFKIITNDGTEEKVLYLCPAHLGFAKREGEVREI